MGASGWAYWVPYHSDIRNVLHTLRQEVFQRGRYYKPAEFIGMVLDSHIGQELPPDVHDDLAAQVDALRSQSAPASIEEVIERNAEDGTHSILDIEDISDTPRFGVAAPLSSDELVDLFGTDQPERMVVEEKLGEVQSWRDRWEGTYVIVYKDGAPDEILFTGFSGD